MLGPVVLNSSVYVHKACPLGGSWGKPPQENLGIPRSFLVQSLGETYCLMLFQIASVTCMKWHAVALGIFSRLSSRESNAIFAESVRKITHTVPNFGAAAATPARPVTAWPCVHNYIFISLSIMVTIAVKVWVSNIL